MPGKSSPISGKPEVGDMTYARHPFDHVRPHGRQVVADGRYEAHARNSHASTVGFDVHVTEDTDAAAYSHPHGVGKGASLFGPHVQTNSDQPAKVEGQLEAKP